MKTKTQNGYLFSNKCSKVGHKRYQNVFEDTDEGITYVYETDDPFFYDGIDNIEEDADHNTFTFDSVELEYEGEEPTDADYERFEQKKEEMHLKAEELMIEKIKNYGTAEEDM